MGISLPGAGGARDRRGADGISQCLQSDGHGDAREILLVPDASVWISRVADGVDLPGGDSASPDAVCDAWISLDKTYCLFPCRDHDPEWTRAHAGDGVWKDGEHRTLCASDAGVLVVAVVVGGIGIFVVSLNALRSNRRSYARAFGREVVAFLKFRLPRAYAPGLGSFAPAGARRFCLTSGANKW